MDVPECTPQFLFMMSRPRKRMVLSLEARFTPPPIQQASLDCKRNKALCQKCVLEYGEESINILISDCKMISFVFKPVMYVGFHV